LKWNQCTRGWKEIKAPWLHIHLYASVWLNWCGMCDDWVIGSYVIILVEMKPVYRGLKWNQGTMVTYAPISFRMVEMIWLLLWLNNESICNHFDWNKIRVLGLKGNQGTMIANGSLWSQWIWNKVWKIVIEC